MRKLIALATLVVAASACSGSPTSSADQADLRPRFDGGLFGGSGNVVTPPPPAPNTTTATGTGVTAADSVNGRGGLFGGSGN